MKHAITPEEAAAMNRTKGLGSNSEGFPMPDITRPREGDAPASTPNAGDQRAVRRDSEGFKK